jgi:hypothetical protein
MNIIHAYYHTRHNNKVIGITNKTKKTKYTAYSCRLQNVVTGTDCQVSNTQHYPARSRLADRGSPLDVVYQIIIRDV